ncbi:hypothetical protein Tco_0729299 [Tanacetum coccineum]|uniref:Uncharacterized protein n=1 Tax=Tanacetum coccineum TaxID=301880 RepID=A0ABQ4YS14_9ASTR
MLILNLMDKEGFQPERLAQGLKQWVWSRFDTAYPKSWIRRIDLVSFVVFDRDWNVVAVTNVFKITDAPVASVTGEALALIYDMGNLEKFCNGSKGDNDD